MEHEIMFTKEEGLSGIKELKGHSLTDLSWERPVVNLHTFYQFKDYQKYLGSNIIGFIVVNQKEYFVDSNPEFGIIVSKVYKENPDETDLVLRKWGRHEAFTNRLAKTDTRLFDWCSAEIPRVHIPTNPDWKLQWKMKIRLLAFQPMRSEKFPGKITIWQCERDRDNDRQVAMKVGKAFKFMFPELEDKELENLVDTYRKEFSDADWTLKVSSAAEDFKHAYNSKYAPMENPKISSIRKSLASSCMRGSVNNYQGFDHLDRHPAEAYASGDFKIVWTENQHGQIGSRCVVHVRDDEWYSGPIYGVDEASMDKIKLHLDDKGATICEDTSWIGARLLRIPHGEDCYIGPYLDLHPMNLYDNVDYLIVSEDGKIDASTYSGVLGGCATCYECGGSVCEDTMCYSEATDQIYCEDCFHDTHFHCEHYETYELMEYACEAHTSHGTILVCESALADEYVECANGEYWSNDDIIWVESEDHYIDPDTYENDYFNSDWDCEVYHVDKLAETEDGEMVSREELDEHWELRDDVWFKVQLELEMEVA